MIEIKYKVVPIDDDVDQLSEFLDFALNMGEISKKARFDDKEYLAGENREIHFHIKKKYLTGEAENERD